MQLAEMILREDQRQPAVDEAIRLLSRLGSLRDATPRTWARAQHNIGFAEQARYGPDRPTALERARKAYEGALEVWSPEASPEDWAESIISLGSVLRDVLPGDRDQHLAEAINLLRDAHARMPPVLSP